MSERIRVVDPWLVLASADHAKWRVEQMDRLGIERAVVPVPADDDDLLRAVAEHGDRLSVCLELDPNRGMAALRRLAELHRGGTVAAAGVSPALVVPQVPIDDRRIYPLYARCVELDLPVCVDVGVPRARVPMRAQHVRRVDAVCAFFPELCFVMRHGAEPWSALAVKLLLRWPRLCYMTSALLPRDYPRAIVDHANGRGREQVLFAGDEPREQVLAGLADVPLRDEVRPLFLRRNALRVFGLDA